MITTHQHGVVRGAETFGLTNTPYELLGGENGVRRLVDRFYDLMDTKPEYRRLRAMHAKNLAPMREKLFDYLSGWLGGPMLYSQRSDRTCLWSVHLMYAIGPEERDAWLQCMDAALADFDLDAQSSNAIREEFSRAAEIYRNR